MKRNEITVSVRLDAKTFRRFSRFDTLVLRRRWLRPTLFALILVGFALVALLSGRPQSGLIGSVLAVVGLGLPLVYFGTFFSQVNLQVVQQRLEQPRHVYDVKLDFDGVHVQNAQKREDAVHLRWKDAQAAFRVKGCVYLYANAARAFLLPDGQASVDDDALWDCICRHMGQRARVRRVI